MIIDQGMKHRLLIICLLSWIIVVSGCSISNQNSLPSDKYVALYEEIHDVGEVVSGVSPMTEGAQPPIPFFYDKSSYNPPGGFPYPINDSLKILFGGYTQKESRVRLVTSLNVVEIYDFPNTPGPGLTITAVENDGTVKMMYDNESVEIAPGHIWTAPAIPKWNETNVGTDPSSGINGQVNRINYTVQYTRTITIENKGVMDK